MLSSTQVLQSQHEVLLGRLDTWMRTADLQSGPLRPGSGPALEIGALPKPDTRHESPGSFEYSVENEMPLFPKVLHRHGSSGTNGTVGSIEEELEHQEHSTGVDSYTLAKQQGSKIETLFKSQSEVHVSTVRTPSCCSTVRMMCGRIVGSLFCEVFFALVIVTNSIYLGIQLEVTATQGQDAVRNEAAFAIMNMFYAVLFLVEVLLRLTALGPYAYFFKTSWAWNLLDVFVVTSTWVELLVSFWEVEGSEGLSNSNLRLLRLVKVSRLARVMRVLRVVQYVKPLRTLMHCLVDTTKSFVWSFLLLFLMMYVFGLLFTDAVLDHLFDQESQTEQHVQLAAFFGSVANSITTLFRSVSNGLDWSTAADALLTGVFCNSAIKAAERDHEMVIQSLQQNKKDFKSLVKHLFRRIDDSRSGMITISEFERHFEDDAVVAFFESLEMNAADAWTLFASLDADGDGAISLEEFVDRCVQLHGPARAVDLYALKQGQVKLRHEIQKIFELQKSNDGKVSPQAFQRNGSRTPVTEQSMTISDMRNDMRKIRSEQSEPSFIV